MENKMKNGQFINAFLAELSDLLEEYNYSIVAEVSPAGFETVNIKSNYPQSEKLCTAYIKLDKDSITKYLTSKLKWEPILEPEGKVKFLGKDITVFEKSGWLAMDKNGSVFYYTDEPTAEYDAHYSAKCSGAYLGTMVGFKKPDAWKESLMYFDLSENGDKIQ